MSYLDSKVTNILEDFTAKLNTDQLASQQTVDQDIHCFQNRIYLDLA